MKLIDALILGWAITFIACASFEVRAESEIGSCSSRLVAIDPGLDADLRVDAERLEVVYQSTAFTLSPKQFSLLMLVVSAPNEVIRYDDLIWHLWKTREPESAPAILEQVVNRLRRKFKRVDPRFNKLRTIRGEGFYWARDKHQRLVVGRIGVAKFIYEGYVDGRALPLMRMEHAILISLLKRQLVSAATVHTSNVGVFKVVACGLTRKFQAILGERLLVPGPWGLGAYRLNPSLRSHCEVPEPGDN